MGTRSKPRDGSLQFWPRKRTKKISVNWHAVEEKNKDQKGILGFIAYKVGMCSALIKDSTSNSLTKDKKIIVPVSVIELPKMKIFSVRFYKNNQVTGEILAENIDKRLKSKVKLPKKTGKKIEDIKDYDDIRILAYSNVKDTGIKKTPDIFEIGISGNLDEKIAFIKEKVGKEILASDFLADKKLIDIRGQTKGKGLQGPVKRFGISLKSHKSEKGVRRPGTLGPWHPAHVIFRVPMAGQLGMFSRTQYNNVILDTGKINEKNINPKSGWENYGNIKTDYIVVKGSVQGTEKRVLLLTPALRKTKKQEKKKYEFERLN